jgi:hypothetical protein
MKTFEECLEEVCAENEDILQDIVYDTDFGIVKAAAEMYAKEAQNKLLDDLLIKE